MLPSTSPATMNCSTVNPPGPRCVSVRPCGSAVALLRRSRIVVVLGRTLARSPRLRTPSQGSSSCGDTDRFTLARGGLGFTAARSRCARREWSSPCRSSSRSRSISWPPSPGPIIEDGVRRRVSTRRPCRCRSSPTRPAQLRTSTDAHRTARGDGSLLGGRILELIRIRSAQLGECQPCMQSRKHDSITDEDVACLLDVGRERPHPAGAHGGRVHRPAVRRPPRASTPTSTVGSAEVFTAAQIIELGFSLRRVDRAAPLHPHARGLRHRRAGHRLLARPGRHPPPGVRPGGRNRLTETPRALLVVADGASEFVAVHLGSPGDLLPPRLVVELLA